MDSTVTPPSPDRGTSRIQITALDGIMNVNSLFTFAAFIGLSWNPTDPSNSLVDAAASPHCAATPDIAENLVAFHVYSFSCFLFSSLVALCLKQASKIVPASSAAAAADLRRRFHVLEHLDVNMTALRSGTLLSAAGSVFGCVFLMLALINVVQVKLGTLACGGYYGYAAVVPLLIFVPAGLLVILLDYALARWGVPLYNAEGICGSKVRLHCICTYGSTEVGIARDSLPIQDLRLQVETLFGKIVTGLLLDLDFYFPFLLQSLTSDP